MNPHVLNRNLCKRWNRFVYGGLLSALLCLNILPVVVAQSTDTTASAIIFQDSRLPVGHSPRGALRRAAMVPGWGQLYNRQYYKLPVVYLALGGILYNVITTNQDYKLYRCAYQYKAFQELVDAGSRDSNPRSECEADYREVVQRANRSDVASSALRPVRNNLRRNRDLSIIGIGLVYGLTLADAFISAHLLDFDVGEDLTVSLRPLPQGSQATVRFVF